MSIVYLLPWKDAAKNQYKMVESLATTSPSPPRVASETLRGAYASLKVRYAKFSRPKLAKASPEGKPRIQPTCHNFGPPALRSKRCVAPMLRQIFRSQNFRGATLEDEGSKGKPWKKKVPTTSRERSQLTIGHPRRERNAAWRPCFAKISASQTFAAQAGGSEFQRQTANPTNLPQFWASRVVIETLRSANASPNFSFPKLLRRNLGGRRFQRQTLEEEGSNNKPRTKPTYHNFWPPASPA